MHRKMQISWQKCLDKNILLMWGNGMFEKWIGKEDVVPQIDIITKWDGKDEKFYAPGALIYVNGGKNLLVERFSEEPGKATYATLMFDQKPLFQLQGDEYFCPTCEKIVRSGYQLEQTEEFCVQKLNCDNVSFEEVLNEIYPILGLLSENYYVVLDTELYPTDGNGHLFWNVPNSDKRMPGSCLYYRGDGEWGNLRPYYTIATQSIKKLNKERVDYYREHSNCRAIAYYMDGYMTALIDGHHKTMAAALEQTKVRALVIMPCNLVHYGMGNREYKKYLIAGDMRFAVDEFERKDKLQIKGDRISADEMECINCLIPNEEFDDSDKYDALATYYPNVEEIACIEAVGEITDERLDRILTEKYICESDEIDELIKAMGGLHHPRLFEVADFFLKKCSYTYIPRYHDLGMIEVIVDALIKMPRSEEMENYLIDLMVECESDYPTVGEKILKYL